MSDEPLEEVAPGLYQARTGTEPYDFFAELEVFKPRPWQVSAQEYLRRLGDAEYAQFLARRKRKRDRYSPSGYHRDLIEYLNADDEEGFKALRMLRGCDSALGV